jgi:hypothetical protein
MKEESSAINTSCTIGGATVGVLSGLWIGVAVWGPESLLVVLSAVIGLIIGMLSGGILANIINRKQGKGT